jgi:DNA-binding MarR family transcriptional regulator
VSRTANARPHEGATAIADLLHSAAIHLLRRVREEDWKSGLSPARLSALSVVVFAGPLTLRALADAEGVRPATMTGVAKALEEEGFIRRGSHPTDKRAVLIEATAFGKRTMAAARARRIQRISREFQALPPTDLAALRRAGRILEQRFGAADRPWRPLQWTPVRSARGSS